jgi:hypothetical protein
MVTYTTDAIRQVIGPIDKIPGRPNFSSLWRLRQQLIAGLKKLKHTDHPTHGYSGYLLSKDEYALVSPFPWRDQIDVGEYFIIPVTAITETEQRTEDKIWQVQKSKRDTFVNLITALTTILENAFDVAFHSGGTALAERGFGTATPPEILSRFQQNYGKPGYQEIKTALLRLTQPMDRMQPIEVMLRGIEEVQMFLLASPDEGRQLSEINLIDHALIKLSETGGMYTKALEKWNGRTPQERKTWAQFREVMVRQYEKMLAEGTGTTISQEGWGAAYNAIGPNDDDNNSLTESIVKYAERATLAESKVSDLESRLSMLEMGGPQPSPPPVNAAYFTPQAPTFQHPAPPATIHVPPQPGPMMQMPPPQQHWTESNQPYHAPPPQYQQQGGTGSQTRRKKRRNNGGGYGGGYGGSPFGTPTQPNRQPPPPSGHYGSQQRQNHVNPQYRQQYQGPPQNRQPVGRGNGVPYSNAIKQHLNLCYCFSCGYDVDHQGFQCPAPRNDHIPTVNRGDAHTIWGASMKAQHKTLPDGTGAGMGWILAQNLRKANFVMDRREENAQQWRQRQSGR